MYAAFNVPDNFRLDTVRVFTKSEKEYDLIIQD